MIFFVACRLLGYWEGQKPQQAGPPATPVGEEKEGLKGRRIGGTKWVNQFIILWSLMRDFLWGLPAVGYWAGQIPQQASPTYYIWRPDVDI